jgi:hypothetical protein
MSISEKYYSDLLKKIEGYQKEIQEVEQILGKALDYPWV